ncbi:class I SAM-dependent methyltransferase [Acidobacteriota bacterium]
MVKITDNAYGKTWDLWVCANCSHIFANPVPTAELMNSLYQSSEDPLYEEESEGREQNFLDILRELEKLNPEKGRLLDVGAATGILMNLAQIRGWRPSGVEPSLWCVDTAKQKYSLDVIQGDFMEVEIDEGQYTAVTMIDFIEHVPHPHIALEKAHKILSSEGSLCIVTPDSQSLTARLMKGRWWHFRPAHLAYFSRSSIEHLLQRCGFKIVKIKKYVWTFSAHYLISRLRFLRFLIKNPALGSFWKKIPIKLALRDSFEIYARKDN